MHPYKRISPRTKKLSCTECSRRKIRCSRSEQCTQCTKRGLSCEWKGARPSTPQPSVSLPLQEVPKTSDEIDDLHSLVLSLLKTYPNKPTTDPSFDIPSYFPQKPSSFDLLPPIREEGSSSPADSSHWTTSQDYKYPDALPIFVPDFSLPPFIDYDFFSPPSFAPDTSGYTDEPFQTENSQALSMVDQGRQLFSDGVVYC